MCILLFGFILLLTTGISLLLFILHYRTIVIPKTSYPVDFDYSYYSCWIMTVVDLIINRMKRGVKRDYCQ